MPRAYDRHLRLPDSGPVAPVTLPTSRSEFYREEFLKHQQCLQEQREYYSERAILEVEEAITKTIAQLDRLCNHCDCDHIVSCLLRQLDQVTNLSAWSDPKAPH
jgi:hypothetical protein